MAGPLLAQLLRELLIRVGMPASEMPLLTSVNGSGFRWNDYMARRLRPVICSTAVRWALGERKRLVAEGLSRQNPHGGGRVGPQAQGSNTTPFEARGARCFGPRERATSKYN